jgi:hypothetical protein
VTASPARLPVSVVIPVHDRAELLPRAVRSALAQTAPPAEIIVVDDCSSDQSGAVASALGCVVLRHERNQGAAAARNTGVAQARHEWLALLDSDDEWLPHHLETVWLARSEHDLVTASALLLDHLDRPERVIGPPFWRRRILESAGDLLYPENPVVASGALVRREAVQAVGGYDTTLRYSEDFDLWTRVLARGTGCSLPEVTILIRAHSGRKSGHSVGPSQAQRTVAQRVQSETGQRSRAELRLGVRAWDDLRRALSDHDLARALNSCAALLARPQRVVGVIGIWFWRRQMTRRARAFVTGGRQRVAVVSTPPGSPLPTSDRLTVFEDWRTYGLFEMARRLLVAPPRAVVATRRSVRLLAKLTMVPTAE